MILKKKSKKKMEPTPQILFEKFLDDLKGRLKILKKSSISDKAILYSFNKNSDELILVRIKNGKIILSKERPQLEKYLEMVSHVYKLPDLMFVYFGGDGMHEIKNQNTNCPVIGEALNKFCKLKYPLLLSDIFFWRFIEDQQRVLNNPVDWNNKINKAVWRGDLTSDFRFTVLGKTQNFEHIFDTGLTGEYGLYSESVITKYDITNPIFIKKVKDMRRDKINSLNQLKYKYILILPGTTGNTSEGWNYCSGSACIKVLDISRRELNKEKGCSEDYCWHTELFKPWEHYIPVEDINDLPKTINWCIKNDDKVKKIAENSRELGRYVFDPKNISKYVFNLFNEYSKYQKYANLQSR